MKLQCLINVFLCLEMEDEYVLHERRLTDLSDQVMALNVRMTDYLQVISDRSEFYRTCQK